MSVDEILDLARKLSIGDREWLISELADTVPNIEIIFKV